MLEKPEVDAGHLWLVERLFVHAGVVKERSEGVILFKIPPTDWNSAYPDTHLRLVRTKLSVGLRKAKPDDYIMDDLRWLFEQHLMEKRYWTFRLWEDYECQKLRYKRLIHVWR